MKRLTTLTLAATLLTATPAVAIHREPIPVTRPDRHLIERAREKARREAEARRARDLAAVAALWRQLAPWFDALAHARDRQLANQGDCYAVERLFARLDPANLATWMGIVWHESSRGMWTTCGVHADNPSSSAFGLTQQLVGQSYWQRAYCDIGACGGWWDAWTQIRVAVNWKNRHGWSAWNGAVGHRAPAK